MMKSSISAGRLIVDGKNNGAWNMAVDEAHMESAGQNGPATLRFYQWSKPTLSLGYFQSMAERKSHAPSIACEVVRRASGGGAILHDRELTYCISMPVTDRWSDVRDLYRVLHTSLRNALATFGIVSDFWARTGLQRAARVPFLCFSRRCPNDLVIDGFKIAGSAQRRNRQSILQHGSVLLGSSQFAPELLGIHELTDTAISARDLSDVWSSYLMEAFSLKFESAGLTKAEEWRAWELAKSRFGNSKWTSRR